MGGTTSSYTYSPTPVGWGNGEQALKCPKSFPGGALNYVSGPCTIFFPYKVGHLLSPETQFKRTWSKFAHFHVTTPSIPQPRPHRRRFCVADGAPGRRLPVARRPATQEGAGAAGEPGAGWPTANWPVLGVSKNVGVSKNMGVSKSLGVENGPPRPLRPFWHPPPPLVAGEGLPGRLGAGPWGRGPGRDPIVVKIYL